jgi:hypothetical protein
VHGDASTEAENVRVSVKAPPNVPPQAGAGSARDSDPPIASRRSKPLRHLTRTTVGWRFQLRVPVMLVPRDLRLAAPFPIIRAALGPLARRDADRLAQQLAALRQGNRKNHAKETNKNRRCGELRL